MSRPRRIAMLSAHTSPLEQPGTGDAGGMNVYVLELSRQLARCGIEVDIFTRATTRHQPALVLDEPGVNVHYVAAGPFEGLSKNDLPAQLCAFVRDVLRAEVLGGPGYFDLVHSHYWLSGQVGTVVAERWGVPLVHSMHTMAKVKNAALAVGDAPEPIGRLVGEEEIVRIADRLIANTAQERSELIELYGAAPGRVEVIHPGVDLDLFRDIAPDDEPPLMVFAGRIQPLKAPDVVLKASALLHERGVRHRVAIIGAPSGSGLDHPTQLVDLADELRISDHVEFVGTVDRAELSRWFSRAAVVCVPSYNESFGLVAIEAQACGTPVVAARVGGLPTAVADTVTGTLVDGHDPADYADALAPLLLDPRHRSDMGAKALRHAESFSWHATACRTIDVYAAAIGEHQSPVQTTVQSTAVSTSGVDGLGPAG